ncbi:MAG TPA: hypothetical protein GXX25_09440 [Desulfotomaculum sp.]|nr:hypothetical protein [Desulfotomaculum sp.]
MRKILSLLPVILLVLLVVPTIAAAEDAAAEEPKTVYEGFVKPLRMAMGDDGAIFVLDGMSLKKCKDGQIAEVANLLASRKYFTKYGLGEIEDIYTHQSMEFFIAQL